MLLASTGLLYVYACIGIFYSFYGSSFSVLVRVLVVPGLLKLFDGTIGKA